MRGLVRACHARMGAPLGSHDLEDAIQDACITAWTKQRSFRGESSLETWLYGIARLTLLEHLAGARRRLDQVSSLDSAAQIPADEGPGPASQPDTGIARLVQQSARSAGSTVFNVLKARGVEGLSFREVASRLQRPESSIKSRYYRALPRIRARLEKTWRDVCNVSAGRHRDQRLPDGPESARPEL